MKKVNVMTGIFIAAVSVFMAGCQMNAVADMGNSVRDYSTVDNTIIGGGSGSGTGSGSGSGSSSGSWALCKNSSYEIFDIQVWGDGAGTFDYANKDGYGRFTITSKGGGWVGGGLIVADTSKTFDFTVVSKMTFDIRGTISPQALCIAIQNNGGASATMYPTKNSLKTNASLSSLSEEDWTTVTFDVSGAASDTIINAFCIIAAGDWSGSFSEGDYFDIQNLDWQDSEGNSVTISLK